MSVATPRMLCCSADYAHRGICLPSFYGHTIRPFAIVAAGLENTCQLRAASNIYPALQKHDWRWWPKSSKTLQRLRWWEITLQTYVYNKYEMRRILCCSIVLFFLNTCRILYTTVSYGHLSVGFYCVWLCTGNRVKWNVGGSQWKIASPKISRNLWG